MGLLVSAVDPLTGLATTEQAPAIADALAAVAAGDARVARAMHAALRTSVWAQVGIACGPVVACAMISRSSSPMLVQASLGMLPMAGCSARLVEQATDLAEARLTPPPEAAGPEAA